MLTIHKASAGSGKTYTLTYSYIKLLLGEKVNGKYRLSDESNRHRAILAITFTNKATEEMKQRIVGQLGKLATDVPCDYRSQLCKELNCSEEQLKVHSEKALVSLLADFGMFNVSTIDAFFQTVLRTFAREANLTGNYEVELDETNNIMVGINEMLSSINRVSDSDSPRSVRTRMLMAWLEQYIRYQAEQGKSYNIFVRKSHFSSELVKFIKNSLNETYKLNSEVIDEYLSDSSRLQRFTKSLSDASRSIKKYLAEQSKQLIADFEAVGMWGRVNHFIRPSIEGWANRVIKIPGKSVVAASADSSKRYMAKYREGYDVDLDCKLQSVLQYAVDNIRLLVFYEYILRYIYNLGIIGEAEFHATEIQKENNAILLNNTGTILQKIINQEEAPFIYERMGVRIKHFLIDEFQDTSKLQWLNLSALVKESLANGHDNLIIGDEKQAIYRFRNSNPQLLIHDVPTEFSRNSIIKGQELTENTNWRSASEVVRFNNTLFTAMASSLGVSDIYSNVVQRVHHKDRKGYVSFAPYTDKEEALDRMTENIVRELKSGYRQRDIAIITRFGNEGAMAVEHLLKAKSSVPELNDLKIVTDEALIIGNASAVKLIVSVLRFIDAHLVLKHSNKSKDNLASIINRYQYFRSKGVDNSDAIKMAFSGNNDEPDRLAMEAAEMECMNIPSVVERIVNRHLSEQVRDEQNVYISAFMDLVIDFNNRSDSDLHSFMKWWDETGCGVSLSVPDELDAIRVMTIHKSKGLEFPCVHVPFADWRMQKMSDNFWFDMRSSDGNGFIEEFDNEYFCSGDIPPFIPLRANKEIMQLSSLKSQYDSLLADEVTDSLNVTYVAFTRAGTELICSYEAVKNNNVDPSKRGELNVAKMLVEAFSVASEAFCSTLTAERHLEPDMLVALSPHVTDGVFELGNPVTPKSDDKEKRSMVRMPSYYSFDNDGIWDMSEIEDLTEMERPRQRGLVLHSIMSDIRGLDDVERAVKRRAMRGYLDYDDIPEYTEMLEEALSDERTDVWFKDYRRVLRERTVTTYIKSKDKKVNYRPDRVVWTSEDTIDVVDYKFGEEEPKEYFRQVRDYMSLMSRSFPGTEVRGFLWYPLKHLIHEVKPKTN